MLTLTLTLGQDWPPEHRFSADLRASYAAIIQACASASARPSARGKRWEILVPAYNPNPNPNPNPSPSPNPNPNPHPHPNPNPNPNQVPAVGGALAKLVVDSRLNKWVAHEARHLGPAY